MPLKRLLRARGEGIAENTKEKGPHSQRRERQGETDRQERSREQREKAVALLKMFRVSKAVTRRKVGRDLGKVLS